MTTSVPHAVPETSNNFTLDNDNAPDYTFENSWNLLFKGTTNYSKKNQNEKDWLSSYQRLYSIPDVPTFWRVFNNIEPWTDLHIGSIYALFKKDIQPSWEDPHNAKGCSYVFYLNRKCMNKESQTELFINVLIMIVGENNQYSSYINGVSFERKYRGDRITLWLTAHSEDMLNTFIDELGIKKTDYTRSVTPSNDNFKIVVKIVDHQEELKQIAK